MTLNFKNPQVSQFYHYNIAANAQFVRDAVMIQNTTKANIYLVKVNEAFANLKAAFPTATRDIKAISLMRDRLLAGVIQLEEKELSSLPLSARSASREYDPKKTPPSALINFSPVGIFRPHGAMNCAFNSLLQCIMNTQTFPKQILSQRGEAARKLTPLIHDYSRAQFLGKPVAEGVDSGVMRQVIGSAVSEDNSSQEDAFDIWQGLSARFPAIQLSMEQTVKQRGAEPSVQTVIEPSIRLKLTKKPKKFFNLIKEFFETSADRGIQIEKRLKGTPEGLVIQADRAFWDPKRGRCNLHTLLKGIPEYFQVPSQWQASQSNRAGYVLRGCVIHTGELNQGHYTSLQRKLDGWYLIDDANVRKVRPHEAKELLKRGYLFFYEKADGPMPIAFEKRGICCLSILRWTARAIPRAVHYLTRSMGNPLLSV